MKAITFLALFLTGCTGACNPYFNGPAGYGRPYVGYAGYTTGQPDKPIDMTAMSGCGRGKP